MVKKIIEQPIVDDSNSESESDSELIARIQQEMRAPVKVWERNPQPKRSKEEIEETRAANLKKAQSVRAEKLKEKRERLEQEKQTRLIELAEQLLAKKQAKKAKKEAVPIEEPEPVPEPVKTVTKKPKKQRIVVVESSSESSSSEEEVIVKKVKKSKASKQSVAGPSVVPVPATVQPTKRNILTDFTNYF